MSEPRSVPRVGRPDSLRAKVHQALRDRIHAGAVGLDERLVDVDIAVALGVSRMPVREALLQLAHEGYLVATTRGFMLPRLTRADMADIFEVRRLLEPRAAAHAARDLTAEGLEGLAVAAALAAEAAGAGDAEALHRANVAFRAGWLGAIANQRLAAAIARFSDQVQAVRLATLRDPETQPIVVEGLQGLLDAFRKRDSVLAADRMARFIDAAELSFTALSGDEAGTTVPGPAAAAGGAR
ncbi:GntR family transcriptional regulator [Segnochrobactrum spirostomi]|uniref:GntR family transcriptional regulator n=1 Tax=Segnochrobactrum spirostomi TaxID=2608987 RepID=A0A6A7Y3F1_9HYPH|nr:GntR family transcriptional regulator [Segnochrobactrum spirostomi]MQT13613.1 GntR family transcriptional regulator [Segnochrobactrum spirostomi]